MPDSSLPLPHTAQNRWVSCIPPALLHPLCPPRSPLALCEHRRSADVRTASGPCLQGVLEGGLPDLLTQVGQGSEAGGRTPKMNRLVSAPHLNAPLTWNDERDRNMEKRRVRARGVCPAARGLLHLRLSGQGSAVWFQAHPGGSSFTLTRMDPTQLDGSLTPVVLGRV